MPFGDGTGPLGTGAPGRGLGPCGRAMMGGRWFGRRGLGLGWGRGGFAQGYGPGGAAASPEEEKGWLRQQAEWLKGQLEGVTRRLDELEKQNK